MGSNAFSDQNMQSSRFIMVGIFVFIALYVYAATLYPGGSQADASSSGFDWINNYWCNLVNEKAVNGTANPARPVAISAMILLSVCLSFFFYSFPGKYPVSKVWDRGIRYGGIGSMAVAALVFTPFHDEVTLLSTLLGIPVLLGIFKAMAYHKQVSLLYAGTGCLVLVVVNNYIYYSHHGLEYLPLLQKVTFLCLLGWILWVTVRPIA